MAEPHPKRHRDSADDHHHHNHHHSDIEPTKRHRNNSNSYINEQQKQQETTQDLFDFFTTLTSDPFLEFNPQPEPDPNTPNPKEIDDASDEKERVIRHLLEASDDELGIPSMPDGSAGGEDEVAGGGVFSEFSPALFDGLWEIEDEAANYYTLLQSELFMQ